MGNFSNGTHPAFEHQPLTPEELEGALADRRAAMGLVKAVLRTDPEDFFRRLDEVERVRGSLEGVAMAATFNAAVLQELTKGLGHPSAQGARPDR